MTAKVLIVGTARVDNDYKAAVLRLWMKCVNARRGGADVLLVDSASPIAIHEIIKAGDMEGIVRRLDPDVGRIETTGVDGPQQAFCAGIEHAIGRGYDWIAHIECDMISAVDVMSTIQRLDRFGIPVACPFAYEYSFVETGLLFMRVNWLRERGYLSAYDWRNPPAECRGDPPSCRVFHEVWFERWAGDDLFILSARGVRNDYDRLTVNNMAQAFPWEPAMYLTHCRDLELYRRMMRGHGIEP